MERSMVNIILCGGSGTRLWPMSRKLFPKQFYPLIGEQSLFQQTYLRNNFSCDRQIVVTGQDLYFMAAHQLSAVGSESHRNQASFLLEPCGRNTAPAIALACFSLSPDDIVLVTPSDHLVANEKEYRRIVSLAEKAASEGKLVTFGIKPAYAETGYGYIEKGSSLSSESFLVKSFREKPDQKTAAEYIASGDFFWNSGMFAFRSGVFLEDLKKLSSAIYDESKKAYEHAKSGNDPVTGFFSVRVPKEDMIRIPSDSIDYAVMEKSSRVAVIPSDFGWNDLGSFDSLYEVMEKDANGNTFSPSLVDVQSTGNLVVSGKRKIATVGLTDCIIIDTPDALLVGKRGSSQLVKQAVELLDKGTARDRELTEVHQTVHRPWGTYSVLEESENFKIKKIEVLTGKRLSLQKHLHRSEHWVVVSGAATVTVGNEIKIVERNESIYIPVGTLHRLENAGKVDLVIIETQVGEYVGEDDIVRIEDDFAREKIEI
jgi:mannose-1-phosphate guanylyltransferase